MSSLRSRTKAKSKAPLYKWSVIPIRNRGQFLGFVEAPDAETAEAAAVARSISMNTSAED